MNYYYIKTPYIDLQGNVCCIVINFAVFAPYSFYAFVIECTT